MDCWTKEEIRFLKALKTPARIQDFVNSLRYRVQGDNETCLSPRSVFLRREAQCIEGAMFAAAALRMNGYPPLILDIEATKDDLDHVVAVFKKDGYWGAISKTNHGVLRYREPVYKTVRELAMSYFHEYFLQENRKKTMRTFSRPVNLSRFDQRGWEAAKEDIWYIPEYLLEIPHKNILNKKQIKNLRKADKIEVRMAEFTEWD